MPAAAAPIVSVGPAGTPIPEPDCGDLHCSRCRQPLRRVKRRDEPAAAAGLFA